MGKAMFDRLKKPSKALEFRRIVWFDIGINGASLKLP